VSFKSFVKPGAISLSLALTLGACLGEVVPSGLAGLGAAWAQTSADPLVTQGVVYVLDHDQWREAAIRGRSQRLVAGQPMWYYLVQLLDGTNQLRAHVTGDRIRTLQQAQSQGLTTNVYDLSTQAGRDEILAIHNDLRRQVGVPPMTWSPELAASAQAWAEQLMADNAFGHSPARRRRRGTIGENLHQRQAPPGMSYATPSRAIAGWVNERNFYTYSTNTCTPGQQCGHYLQMVWADTRQMGCGMARAADARREVWACHYYPGGIVPNQRPY
jgi:uncharacterized protein YkwD